MDQGLFGSPGKEELNFHTYSYFCLELSFGCLLADVFFSPLSVLTTPFLLGVKEIGPGS